MARPRLELDEDQILALAEIQCTYKEMAAVMNCSTDTLKDRYSDLIEKGRENGKSSLRRIQYRKALDGNITMLIWLGKQYLEQKERVEQTPDETNVFINNNNYNKEELKNEIERTSDRVAELRRIAQKAIN